MATAIKQFSGTVGSTGGTSINWTNEDADLELCLGNSIDKKKNFASLISQDNPDFVSFKPDGSKMFITTDGTDDGITSFDLATNWDIESTLSNQTSYNYMGAFSVSSNSVCHTVWNNDGTQFLVTNDNATLLSYYNLSSAYDLSSAGAGSSLEEFEGGQSGFKGGCWIDSGNTFVAARSDEFQIYKATTAYDFSTLNWLAELKVNSFTSRNLLERTIPTINNIFSSTVNNMFLVAQNTSAYGSSITRLKPRVTGYPQTIQMVDSQHGSNNSVGSSTNLFFTPDGNYMYIFPNGGNYTTSYSGNHWLFRKPTTHTVASDQTIYTVPSGKVAKVTMNMSGQSANVYVGTSKIAQLKGGASIRHTEKGHLTFKARDYQSVTGSPTSELFTNIPSVDFFARGGTRLSMSDYENEGPEFFMLDAGESLILKNSVSVNFDIQVIEDNAA